MHRMFRVSRTVVGQRAFRTSFEIRDPTPAAYDQAPRLSSLHDGVGYYKGAPMDPKDRVHQVIKRVQARVGTMGRPQTRPRR
jgi:hypothetical protein